MKMKMMMKMKMKMKMKIMISRKLGILRTIIKEFAFELSSEGKICFQMKTALA